MLCCPALVGNDGDMEGAGTSLSGRTGSPQKVRRRGGLKTFDAGFASAPCGRSCYPLVMPALNLRKCQGLVMRDVGSVGRFVRRDFVRNRRREHREDSIRNTNCQPAKAFDTTSMFSGKIRYYIVSVLILGRERVRRGRNMFN
jgi:hypothetical protein